MSFENQWQEWEFGNDLFDMLEVVFVHRLLPGIFRYRLREPRFHQVQRFSLAHGEGVLLKDQNSLKGQDGTLVCTSSPVE